MSNATINPEEIRKQIALVKKEGKDILINDEADKAVAMIKIYEGRIQKTIEIIREVAKEALSPYNVKTMRGKYVNITVSAPRKVNEYSIDDTAKEKFYKKEYKIVPNKEAIEKYIEKTGQLPVGVHRNELKQSVSIKLKQNALNDLEGENYENNRTS